MLLKSYIYSLIYFNLSFNRLAEYGTDKAGHLLIVILIIRFLKFLVLIKTRIMLKI